MTDADPDTTRLPDPVSDTVSAGTHSVVGPAGDPVAAPATSADPVSVDQIQEPLSPPSQSTPGPVPSKDDDTERATPAETHPAPPAPPQSQPRIVGGFEVDDDPDDGDENDDGTLDGNEEGDVYDPSLGLDFDAPTPALSNALDRTSQSPVQENGITAASNQATGSSGDISSSVAPLGVDAPPAAASTSAPEPPTKLPAPDAQVNGTAAATVPKTRLAHDIIGILEDRIKEDPRGDAAAYLELIEELKSRNKQDDVRRVYEQYLAVFPLAAEQWYSFVKWEEEHDRMRAMETLFNRSLLEVLDVQLWSLYINYIRRRNSMQSGDVGKSYSIINESFRFALKTVGMDKDSGTLWQDYLDFLKSGPGIVGGTGWQDGAKADALREAYQKAIAVPTAATTTLWKEYDGFETGLSKINGRKYLQEKSPAYMSARTAYTQLQNLTRDLRRTSRPQLPPALGFDGYTDYMHQVNLWKQWIAWEKEDNLVLKDEDPVLLRDRILLAYKQALMALQFWPEMWYDAVDFCFANGLESEGVKLLNQGIAANPESLLLAFKLADKIEISTQNDEGHDPGAKERMKKIREPYDKALNALYDLIKKVAVREQREIRNVELASTGPTDDESGDEEIHASNVAAKKAALDSRIEVVKKAAQVHTDILSRMISHAWIALMRATRRVQGKGLPTDRGPSGFRTVFGEARKRGKLTSDFYVESAQIEWQCYRDPTGTKILDRGMKLFPEDDYLPLQYVKHLFDINDVTNARAVFETTVKRLLAHGDAEHTAKSKPLFAFLHAYESRYGELAQVQSLEERMKKHFPDDPTLALFSSRYSTPSFDVMTAQPIISPSQIKPPPGGVVPSVEVQEAVNSPFPKVVETISTHSPKRPFPDDFDDVGPRKLARGESPLKGAAGRRMHQQQSQAAPASQQQTQRPVNPPAGMAGFPAPAPLPPQISYLLSIIPKASAYVDARLDAAKMVDLIRDVHLPPSAAIAGQHAQNPAWPVYPSHHQSSLPPPGMIPTPGASQGPYSNAPYRYT